MTEPGQIDVALNWDGAAVTRVTVRSSRPQVARVLVGRPPDQVSHWVGMLFTLCGRAQRLCAHRAVIAASGGNALSESSASSELHAVVAERVFEHLWRIWIDWPQRLGLATQRQAFAELAAPLRSVSDVRALRDAATAILTALRRQHQGRALDEIVDTLTTTDGAGASWLAGLLQLDPPGPPATPRLLPGTSLRDWVSILPTLDTAFAQAPVDRGQPAETGALAAHGDDPVVHALQADGRPIVARVAARLRALARDLAALADDALPAGQIDAVELGGGEALACVATARGPLLHRVLIRDGRIADYVIVAPTEWNFHPQGTLSSAFAGRRFADADALRGWADALMLALDPCVPVQLTLHRD